MKKLQLILVVVPIMVLISFLMFLNSFPTHFDLEWSTGTSATKEPTTYQLAPIGWVIIAAIVIIPIIIWSKYKKLIRNSKA